MNSFAEEKLTNMEETVAVTAPLLICCSGIDSAVKSKAGFDIKKKEKVHKQFAKSVSEEQLQAAHWYNITDVLVRSFPALRESVNFPEHWLDYA